MLTETQPEAMAIFSSTADHPALVAAAAKHHVHAMMEKPLAVSVADGESIAQSAKSGNIQVIVNYETTWYPSMAETWRLLKQPGAGRIRKLVAMDGHEGPKEINVQPEFLAWLTDPVKNGGGALYDFGCYGANLMTWMMDNERPRSVFALTQQQKPAIYARVDDEATILVEYAGAQGIIQASWNWPFGRKDFEVYTEHAYAIATGGGALRVRTGPNEERKTPPPLPADVQDSISDLTAVVRGTRQADGPSSLANNLIVTEILAAARESAKTGKAVTLGQPTH
jgi:predicted dehydrogenase